jgi:hypothetical protein
MARILRCVLVMVRFSTFGELNPFVSVYEIEG